MVSIFGLDLENLSSSLNKEEKFDKPQESIPSNTPKRKPDELLDKLIKENSQISEEKKFKSSFNSLEFKHVEVPRVKIFKLESLGSCTHEVAIPHDLDYKPPVISSTSQPARSFPFELDSFQKNAILCIDNNESALISAHTSAGKTVVAEYAIATGLLKKQRVIYTTPIKALSNQKFREFSEIFPEVGLITGDATINPNANVLIMTTEILHTMLYRGSHIIREVGWVIFDEIHYMNNPERGVVWEESIILLADHIHMIFLSATISNGRQFAEWIAHLHKQPCHVVSSDHRPVPLHHYIFPPDGDGLVLIKNEDKFLDNNFMSVVKGSFSRRDSKNWKVNNKKESHNGKNDSTVVRLLKLVKHRNLEPVIVFSFSRKECENYALQMSKLDFSTDAERKIIEEVFENAIDCLSVEDKSLPQMKSVLPLLRRGIGIHHSGLLPILKEIVEILFGEGLIKCLFATETFSMGLNMPARTVLFTSPRKFDGTEYRWINSGEYTQMSGRAGRRGKDESGTVILIIDEMIKPEEAKEIVTGNPAPLNSAYKITYNMIFNLLRVDEINPEYLMEKSFCQYQNYHKIPDYYKDLENLKKEHESIAFDNEQEVESYYRIKKCINEINQKMWKIIVKPIYIVQYLQIGRLIKVCHKDHDYGWGIVINLKKRNRSDKMETDTHYIVDVLCNIPRIKVESKEEEKKPTCHESEGAVVDSSSVEQSDPQDQPCIVIDEEIKNKQIVTSTVADIVPITLKCITGISAVRLFVPKELISSDAKRNLLDKINTIKQKLNGKLPDLDPVNDIKITETKFVELYDQLKMFQGRLLEHNLHQNIDLAEELCQKMSRKEEIQDKITKLAKGMHNCVSLIQMTELVDKKRVLRRLDYCTEDDMITLKGRVACEVTSSDELVLTEMLFDGVFNRLSPEQIASVLSCFVCEEKSKVIKELDKDLSTALRQLQDIARRIGRITFECGLISDVEDYVDSFKPHMMHIVYQWANGKNFSELCESTDIFEGTIVRTMRRLEELIRQLINAATTIESPDLTEKFKKAIEKIKRDIVFANSLYF